MVVGICRNTAKTHFFFLVCRTARRSAAGMFLTALKRCRPTRVLFPQHLYSGYYHGNLETSQYVQPNQTVKHGGCVTRLRSLKNPAVDTKDRKAEAAPVGSAVAWDEASSADVLELSKNEGGRQREPTPSQTRAPRPYVPLSEVAMIELQGDYCMDGGRPQDALQRYGVVAKAYRAAYPLLHNKVAAITIKLGRAFRLVGSLDSSLQNLEHALYILDRVEKAMVESVCEGLTELALTKEQLHHKDTGEAFEEAVTFFDTFHDIGVSHRTLRFIPRLGKRMGVGQERMSQYYSPYDYDRTFAIIDEALIGAERWYRSVSDSDGVLRVLERRSHTIDRKFFNMRQLTGRIQTWGGEHVRTLKARSGAPSADEVLLFSPTVHQPYRDWSMERTAPLGHEDEVQPGINRKVVDDGDPLRRQMEYSRHRARTQGIAREYQQSMWERGK